MKEEHATSADNGGIRHAVGAPKVFRRTDDGRATIYVGDCRKVLETLPEACKAGFDLVFADPPFNWNRAYDQWNDAMPEHEYLAFTYDWLDLCVRALRPGGALWVNIPDDWAAEIVCYLKGRLGERRPPAPMVMRNWCVWHYRFGQNTRRRFINSKVHVLYFIKSGGRETWNPDQVLEMSDRASIYFDPRTQRKKDGLPPGLRVPLDVWYGPNLGRVQGNNRERRQGHDNQLPEAYLARVILSTSNEGDLLLDPFLGSGTTGVVAYALRRRFVGVEYSRANANRAFERILTGPARPITMRGVSTAIFPARRRRACPSRGATLGT
jgi:DNA modification methylase